MQKWLRKVDSPCPKSPSKISKAKLWTQVGQLHIQWEAHSISWSKWDLSWALEDRVEFEEKKILLGVQSTGRWQEARSGVVSRWGSGQWVRRTGRESELWELGSVLVSCRAAQACWVSGLKEDPSGSGVCVWGQNNGVQGQEAHLGGLGV